MQLGVCSFISAVPPLSHFSATTKLSYPRKLISPSVSCRSSKLADRLLADFSPNATTLDPPASSFSFTSFVLPIPERSLPLPINMYQVLGAEPHFSADGVRRAFEDRVSRTLPCGYTADALAARRKILQAAFDTIRGSTARVEFNGTSTVHVPWDKVAGALCLLQECGEAETVLQVGRMLLSDRLPKPFKQDVVLAMALSYVDQSRDAMDASPHDFIRCCELLEWALKLLQEEGASILAPDLRTQIEETLEEINPRYALDLLALPLEKDFCIRREMGIRAARNILSTVGSGGASAIGGGFTREEFMYEVFLRITSAEMVDLFNSKPSHIHHECFEIYGVALAHVAQAIVGKKPPLIKNADKYFQLLQQTEDSRFASLSEFYTKANLGRGLCSLLLGKLDDCRIFLGIDSKKVSYVDQSVVEFVVENSVGDKKQDLLPGFCKLLERWLMIEVLSRFRDTMNLQFRLGDYYDDPTVLLYLESLEGFRGSALAAIASIVRMGAEATTALGDMKSSALHALGKMFPHTGRVERIGSTFKMLSEESVDTCNVDIISAPVYEVSGKLLSEDVEKENWSEMLKQSRVETLLAGVVVVLLILMGIKYLTGRDWPLVSRNEICAAIAAVVPNSGFRWSNAKEMSR